VRWVAVVLLAVGIVIVLLLYGREAPDRARGERPPATREGPSGESPATAPPETEPSPAAPRDAAPIHGRLRDETGDPVAAVQVNLAVGFPMELHTFRSGYWPARTVWLCPFVDSAESAPDGSFSLPSGRTGARRVLFTSPSSPVHLLAEVPGAAADLRTEPKCSVTGVLRDRDGNPLRGVWVEGCLGPREDWHVRIDREKPLYVSSGGPLDIDDAAPVGVESDDEGRFTLPLRPGACTLAFGDQASLGSLPLQVRGSRLELGEFRLPLDADPIGEGRHDLVVQVYDAQGAPRADAEVLLWDGVVGTPSHSEWTGEDGRARFEGLRASEVMAWTVPVDRPYLAEPEQCTGRLRLPCSAPVALRARRPEEYVVLRFHDMGWGYCLLVQGDRLLGGFDVTDTDGLAVPPGEYHAIVVGRRVILEGDLALRGAPEVVVDRGQLTVTARG